MSFKSINYYGYDKDTYNDCRDLINNTNHSHLKMLNLWLIFNNILFIIFSYFYIFGASRDNIVFYASFLLAAVVFGFILLKFPEFSVRHSKLFYYIGTVIFMVYGIISSAKQPYMAATIYLGILIVVALSFIDTLYSVVIMMAVFSGIFLYSSFTVKPISIAYQDMYNSIIFLILALALHYAFQHSRMDQFVTYKRNEQISRELEIRSSYDSLTSLLNRGAFFSLTGEILRMEHKGYMAVCLIDLDGFKQINDQLGHQMGDKAIQIAGQTILNTLNIDMRERWNIRTKALASPINLAGRLGGDEFILIIRDRSCKEEIVTILKELLHN
ncbi:MAG: GGDEF domain-containing protein, partial [Lachnospiraceae bacterium]|nr:GGDEF domain-containing protein [Lachnospiraceae bacterium]